MHISFFQELNIIEGSFLLFSSQFGIIVHCHFIYEIHIYCKSKHLKMNLSQLSLIPGVLTLQLSVKERQDLRLMTFKVNYGTFAL